MDPKSLNGEELESFKKDHRSFVFVVNNDVIMTHHLRRSYVNAERLGNALASNPQIIEVTNSGIHYGWKYDGENFIAPDSKEPGERYIDKDSRHFVVVVGDSVYGSFHFPAWEKDADRIFAGFSSNPTVIETDNPLIDYGWKYDGENFIPPTEGI